MVLATGLAFFMLFWGGGGGLINMSYGMNAMVHNTSWVTAHFHLIFGGTVVIMYFAIAYAMWPTLTGRAFPSLQTAAAPALAMVHRHDGDDPAVALDRAAGAMAPDRRVRLFRPADRVMGAVGHRIADRRHHPCGQRAAVRLEPDWRFTGRRRRASESADVPYAEAVHPPAHLPASLNGFGLWNLLVARPDAAGLRLSDRPILHRSAAASGGSQAALRWTSTRPPTAMIPPPAHRPSRRRSTGAGG